jgi:hypothetical protein
MERGYVSALYNKYVYIWLVSCWMWEYISSLFISPFRQLDAESIAVTLEIWPGQNFAQHCSKLTERTQLVEASNNLPYWLPGRCPPSLSVLFITWESVNDRIWAPLENLAKHLGRSAFRHTVVIVHFIICTVQWSYLLFLLRGTGT